MTATHDEKQLRTFGLTVGGIFAIVGLWPSIVRGEDPRIWALALGLMLALPALALPRILGPLYQIWMALGTALNWINTRIILGVIFYGIVTPFGVAIRLRGKDPMHRRFDPGADTYRVLRHPRPGTHMTRQF